MFIVDVIVTIAAVVANLYAAMSDFTRGRMAMSTSARVHVPATVLPVLGALKTAGALGLLAGLLGFHYLGVAAAVGLTLFFAGAIGVHLRAREHRFVRVTIGYFLLAVAAGITQALT